MKYCVKFEVGDGYYSSDYTRMFDNKEDAVAFANTVKLFYKEVPGLISSKLRHLGEVKVVSFEEEMI